MIEITKDVMTICEWCRQSSIREHIHQGIWWPLIDSEDKEEVQ